VSVAHTSHDASQLPREIADGVFWLGACIHVTFQGRVLHGYHSSYLIAGDDCSLLVEAGHPKDLTVLETQLENLLASGLPELRYVFTTHAETPHCGGIGRMLDNYPSVVGCGDMSDLHLVFPQFEDRLLQLDPGDEIDLGGTTFKIVEAVFRDYAHSRWGFDTARKALFSGDGFAYSHYHEAGMCGHLAEEVPELEIPGMTRMFAELALYWTRFTELDPLIARLDKLVFDELSAELIGPTHGLPIGKPAATFPAIRDGLRLGGQA
jgi:flavorubredoxin